MWVAESKDGKHNKTHTVKSRPESFAKYVHMRDYIICGFFLFTKPFIHCLPVLLAREKFLEFEVANVRKKFSPRPIHVCDKKT